MAGIEDGMVRRIKCGKPWLDPLTVPGLWNKGLVNKFVDRLKGK